MSRQDAPQEAVPASSLAASGPLGMQAHTGVLAAIALVATVLRLLQLGRLSFWYDEVVTMRLAKAGSPGALVECLFQIDATRAPLHPLLLQYWIKIFGSSEAGARSLSVLFGIATVVLIYEIGRVTFDTATGLWAAWLASLSPLLIVYSREARMYAWLVLVTCVCWRLLLALHRSFAWTKALAYAISLTALAYSHPLGLLMLSTLAVAALLDVRKCFETPSRWLIVHLGVLALLLPWIGHYFDHSPESQSGRLPPRFLLGTPIGFIGGNFLLLFFLVLLIAIGITGHGFAGASGTRWHLARERWRAPGYLLLWLIPPPVALYLYSWVAHPIFGPARYTVFVAPAYLVLVAAGLSRLPAKFRIPLALALAVVSGSALISLVYDPELKADWRGFSAALAEGRVAGPRGSVLVIVASADPNRNVEVETARYYLPAGCKAMASDEATPARLAGALANEVYLAVGARRGVPMSPVPKSLGPYRFREDGHYPGLIVYRGDR